jgi:hypothetical protein
MKVGSPLLSSSSLAARHSAFIRVPMYMFPKHMHGYIHFITPLLTMSRIKFHLGTLELKPFDPLQVLVSAMVYNKAAEKTVTAPRLQQVYGVEAGAFAMAFLACPQQWREKLGGKLVDLAIEIVDKHKVSLHSIILEVNISQRHSLLGTDVLIFFSSTEFYTSKRPACHNCTNY